MGNTQSIRKINYEDIQIAIKNTVIYTVINTLPPSEQQCLILNTIVAADEERIVNRLLAENKHAYIILYGKNCNDETVTQKYNQLKSLGFSNVYVYFGGMFEWLLLQDIYGTDFFPTTKKESDLLKFKSKQLLHIGLLEY